jgi:TolB protein
MFASWSLDGSRIVYTNIRSGDMPAGEGLLLVVGDIWTMNADGSDQRQITSGPIYGALPSFSPDGRSILFTSNATGNPELWLMNVDGTDPHPITHTTGSGAAKDGTELNYSSHGSFSPDGTKIAYASTQSGNLEVWVMDSNGSNPIQLTFPNDLDAPDAHNPTWSPDGGKIVHYGGFARSHGYIFTMNPDGSDRTQLTFEYPSDDPSWSPDGQQIFYDILRDGQSQTEAWIMNRDGTDQKPLSATPVYPTRVPAITKLEAVTVPDDLNAAQPTGFDFQDITPLVSARESPDISVGGLNDSGTTESGSAFFTMNLESNHIWNDTGDVGGSGDGCF